MVTFRAWHVSLYDWHRLAGIQSCQCPSCRARFIWFICILEACSNDVLVAGMARLKPALLNHDQHTFCRDSAPTRSPTSSCSADTCNFLCARSLIILDKNTCNTLWKLCRGFGRGFWCSGFAQLPGHQCFFASALSFAIMASSLYASLISGACHPVFKFFLHLLGLVYNVVQARLPLLGQRSLGCFGDDALLWISGCVS